MMPGPGDRDRIDELAALTAAGAATGTERAELETLLADDLDARALARSYGEAATLLALALDEPPPPAFALEAVRQRVRGRPVSTPGVVRPAPMHGPGGSGEVIPIGRAPRKPRSTVATLAMVGLPLAAAAGFAFLWANAQSDRDQLANQLSAVQQKLEEVSRTEREAAAGLVELQRKLDQLGGLREVATPRLQLATVQSKPQGATMKILVDPDNRRWLVLAFELPPLPADKDYQLWFMPEKGDPVSAGLLVPGPGGWQQASTAVPPDLKDVKGAAISLEPKGGSPKPTEVIMGGPFI